ncbi:MAG: hypothetical protein Crog4KO_00510 [Crocinitomicaceae bacterium]
MSDNLNFTIRTFATNGEAHEIQKLLEKEGIPSKVSEARSGLAPIFVGNELNNKFELLIDQNDADRANELFMEWAKSTLDTIPEDYYLYDFSDDELKKVLAEVSEWSELDVLLAKKILLDRKVEIDETQIKQNQEERIEELQKPESGQEVWIVLGYILSLLGGLFGAILGYALWQAKKRLPDGSKVFAYDSSARTHGQIIFFISIAVLLSVLILRFLGAIALS